MSITEEFVGVNLGDKRLNGRIVELARTFEKNHGQSICLSCGKWSSAKAAYRFFDNDRFDEQKILKPHIESTIRRVNDQKGKVLVIHDTTEFNYSHHHKTQGLGYLTSYKHSRTKQKIYTQGLLMHTSMAMTPAGVPLGLLYQKLWNRDVEKRRKIRNAGKNFTRVPIEEKESYKWIDGINKSNAAFDPDKLVHVGDRDADIFELFDNSRQSGRHFVVRAVHSRCTALKGVRIYSKISTISPQGQYVLNIQGSQKRRARIAKINVRFYKVRVVPPVDKAKDFEPVDLYVVSAKEKGNRNLPLEERVNWKLLTDLPVTNFDNALEKIHWYQTRWAIEIYFKILKSGCGLDKSRLRHGKRIKKFISLMSVVGWRIFWMTKISRTARKEGASHYFTNAEKHILSDLETTRGQRRLKRKGSVQEYTIALARLGGYLARNSDPPPGPIVMWRAMLRLNDMVLARACRKCG
jgi:IS4 transposase